MAKQLATCDDDDEEISDNDTFDYDHEFFDHDPFFDECKNGIIGIESFTECFTRRYKFCPTFFSDSLQDACQTAFNSKVINERYPVLVYIHHDQNMFSNIFCSDIFCSKIIIEYLRENYIVWPWDITFESKRNQLIQIWSEMFSIEFLNVSIAEQCPMLIGIMRRSARTKDWSLTGEYEVKLLLNGDTLTRTQERSTYETLLRELIIFKEEFDDNEQALISSQFWNSIKRFEIRCAGPICIHYNLNELTMKYLRNYTIEYLLLDVGHLPLPSIYECLNFHELCFLMITNDFISKIRNVRHVHLIIINEDNLKKLLNASEWTRLAIICHQLKKITLQIMRSILEDQQLTKKIA
ncbi:unnamed protein product [Rotaria sordida]|uniref:UAS domain-containing protein n=1 Tax=Rotaria sordida TaxID=392033 RepID=A0A819AX67_9BILA|nr:unnamed protein product [Rotaria sordida]